VKRRHFVELHELPWCPEVVRRLATDYLSTVSRIFGAHRPIVPRLRELLRDTGTNRVVDLCSGGSGPIVQIAKALGDEVSVVLTDLYPNETAFERAARSAASVRGELSSIDARAIPSRLGGVRTLFDAFHHFRPDDARRILRDAKDRGAGILVVEGTERSVRGVLSLCIAAPLLVLLLTPFVRPFTWWRFVLTYLVPLAPFLVLFDGVVSCLRTYTVEELRGFTRELASPEYLWDVGVDTVAGQPLTWLVGRPRT